ncbi:DUF6879 family protein [Streptomyces johnsoniae]|uniref:DUF6879 domain-containing protein n=1 Tax=Streptomyces johnsoniae TaxID=3075532 RepID=A0ABU2S4R5_9ACTN|nr:DUF6879 family protein [Streptomyces sp. DSM 41886]MDT0443902.1 hypothetical protein [Streptomyces sp. DSM 41886]
MAETPSIRELFQKCRRSAWHLEMRDGYMKSDPSYIAWARGERETAEDFDPERRPWLRLMRESTDRGIEVRRARIVSEPVSDYIRFEHHVTDPNVAAGEKVKWLPRRQATDLALPGNDFWLFDEEVLLVHHFDGEGELAPVDAHELVEDPAVIKLCGTAFEAIWSRAVPHEEYRLS